VAPSAINLDDKPSPGPEEVNGELHQSGVDLWLGQSVLAAEQQEQLFQLGPCQGGAEFVPGEQIPNLGAPAATWMGAELPLEIGGSANAPPLGFVNDTLKRSRSHFL
jgi:hypothetical protein